MLVGTKCFRLWLLRAYKAGRSEKNIYATLSTNNSFMLSKT